MDQLSSQLIVNILRTKMGLPQNAVWVRDQNMKIPNDNGVYISAGIVNTTIISSQSYMREGFPLNTWDMLGREFDMPGDSYDSTPATPPVMTEGVRIQAQEMVQIDIFSRSNAGIFRNWEVIAALQSIYSQQVQELHNFKIFVRSRSFLNTSYAEGGSQLNRYTITIACLVWYVKEQLLAPPANSGYGPYYDDFSTRVDDEKTIGSEPPYNYDVPGEQFDQPDVNFDSQPPIIEFEINQQGILP